MRNLILPFIAIVILSASAFAQQIWIPCIYDASPPNELQLVEIPGVPVYGANGQLFPGPPIRVQKHVPRWEQRESSSQVYKVNAGSWWHLLFYMPASGQCVGEFSSYDDRSDTFKVVQDAAGQWVRVPVRTQGDIEIIIVPESEYARIGGRLSSNSYIASYTSGRSYGGQFTTNLAPGWYRLIVYNGYSLAAKSVNLSFGGKLPTKPDSTPFRK